MPPPTESDILSITALTLRVRTNLEQQFSSVWVAGEVTGFKKQSSGHWYLTLKDPGAKLEAVVYFAVNVRLKFEPHDGMQVIAGGKLSVYEPRGVYQLQVDYLEPKGLGAAELALRQLKEKLHKKGYFDQRRKRALQRYPKRAAVVTSVKAAALRDM